MFSFWLNLFSMWFVRFFWGPTVDSFLPTPTLEKQTGAMSWDIVYETHKLLFVFYAIVLKQRKTPHIREQHFWFLLWIENKAPELDSPNTMYLRLKTLNYFCSNSEDTTIKGVWRLYFFVKRRASLLALGSSLNFPNMTLVIVLALIFCTPLITMHMWLETQDTVYTINPSNKM